VSLIQAQPLFKLFGVAELLHVLHKEVGLLGLEVDKRALGKVEADLLLETRIQDELFLGSIL
jgi:hypothetical protein